MPNGLIHSFLLLSCLTGQVDTPTVHRFGDSVCITGGALSGANHNVLESVAYTRMAGHTAKPLPADTNLAVYDALIATESCDFVGLEGEIFIDGLPPISVLVVDCQASNAPVTLTELDLLADVNQDADHLWHREPAAIVLTIQ